VKYPHRKNFLPAFIVNLILWFLWIIVVFFLSPSRSSLFVIHNSKIIISTNIIAFFLALTLALTLTFAFIFANTRRGFLLAVLVNGILFFRMIKLASWWNILLLFLVLIAIELFFSRKNTPKT